MPGTTLILAAAAAATTATASSPPDIALTARVQAREVRIEQQGQSRVRVWAEPSAGDKVDVERNLPRGQRRYRNLDIRLDAEARIAAPDNRSQTGE